MSLETQSPIRDADRRFTRRQVLGAAAGAALIPIFGRPEKTQATNPTTEIQMLAATTLAEQQTSPETQRYNSTWIGRAISFEIQKDWALNEVYSPDGKKKLLFTNTVDETAEANFELYIVGEGEEVSLESQRTTITNAVSLKLAENPDPSYGLTNENAITEGEDRVDGHLAWTILATLPGEKPGTYEQLLTTFFMDDDERLITGENHMRGDFNQFPSLGKQSDNTINSIKLL